MSCSRTFSGRVGSGRGRPSVPADVIASAFVLKELEGLSDRQAAAALSRDIAWKAACGLALDSTVLHDSVATQDTAQIGSTPNASRCASM